jgi:hypothetical protein
LESLFVKPALEGFTATKMDHGQVEADAANGNP